MKKLNLSAGAKLPRPFTVVKKLNELIEEVGLLCVVAHQTADNATAINCGFHDRINLTNRSIDAINARLDEEFSERMKANSAHTQDLWERVGQLENPQPVCYIDACGQMKRNHRKTTGDRRG
jgi:hypothetical protein